MAGEASQDEVAILRERLSALQHLAGVGFWEWRIPEDHTVWTDSMYRLFGFEPGNFGPSYQAWLDLVHEDDREHVHELVQKAFESQSGYAFDHRIIRPNGEIRILHCRGQVFMEDGEAVRIAGISEDVTSKRSGEEELRRFIADAAHELRTPVAAIEAAAQLITRARIPAHTEHGMTVLRRQVDRLNNLTTSLLDLEAVRPEGRVGLVMESIELAPVLSSAVAAATFGDGEEVVVQVDPVGMRVRGTREHLDRIAVILLENARRYGGDHVRVTARRLDETHVVVEVADDGPGVPVELHQTLFMPFSRGRQADGAGAGLGLAIFRRLVESLGGDVSHHERDGGGATFRFTLEADE